MEHRITKEAASELLRSLQIDQLIDNYYWQYGYWHVFCAQGPVICLTNRQVHPFCVELRAKQGAPIVA